MQKNQPHRKREDDGLVGISPNNDANGKAKLFSRFGACARLRFLLFLPVLFSLFLPVFCRETSAIEKTVYTLAAYPTNDPKKVFYAIKPLADHISLKTGWEVRTVVTGNYEEMIQRLTNGSVDMGLLNSANYVSLGYSIPGLSYIATYLEWDRDEKEKIPFYRLVIVAAAGGSIENLDDLRGKRFGFTDRYSTSGYMVPLFRFGDRTIDPKAFFGKMFFLGRQESVFESLREGSIDAGAVSAGMLAAASARYGKIFREIAFSDPIPLDAFVSGRTMPNEDVLVLRDILCSLKPDSAPMEAIRRNMNWPAAGFAVLEDSFYDSLRRALGIGAK